MTNLHSCDIEFVDVNELNIKKENDGETYCKNLETSDDTANINDSRLSLYNAESVVKVEIIKTGTNFIEENDIRTYGNVERKSETMEKFEPHTELNIKEQNDEETWCKNLGIDGFQSLDSEDIQLNDTDMMLQNKNVTTIQKNKCFMKEEPVGHSKKIHPSVITEKKSKNDKEKFISSTEYSRSFTYKSHSEAHMLIHSDKVRFICKECSKSFTRKSHLNRHMLIHTSVKQFSCNECSKSFTQISSLNTHMLSHTGVKQFSCNICSNSFTRKSHLNRHMLIHGVKQFSCYECSKSFTYKTHLNTHMLIHTNMKQFSCNKCSKSFAHKSNLNRHMLIHTGVKPFSCNECSKSFTHKSIKSPKNQL